MERKVRHSHFRVIGLLVVVLLLAACGPAKTILPTAKSPPTETRLPRSVITGTPKPDYAATATVSALATENACLATQVATLAVPTSTPTPSLGKLAYVQGGDIWVKTLPDGEPQRVTTDGRNSTPRWSPSGEWLAFHKDVQVWLIRADGSDLHPIDKRGPVSVFAWSSVEDRLACIAGSGILRLEVINADGTDLATLIPLSICAAGILGRIAWSPDGRWIAYGWREELTYQGLWKISADGEERSELYASGVPEKGDAILAGWLLDNQHILFWQGDILSASMLADGVALYSLPAGGGEPTKLVDTVLVHDDFVAPAPQGDRLAVTTGGYRATWTNKRIAVVEVDGGEPTWLTDESVAAFSPAWSPDGIHLAYVAMPDEGDLVGGEDARLGMMERRIWVINAQGEPQLQQLTDDPAYRDERPLWSADGSHVLFARMDAEGGASLWLIPAAGGEPQRVVDELTPLPGPASGWFGYYGHVEWDQLFDWWRGPVRAPEGVAVPTPGPSPTPIPPTYTPPMPPTYTPAPPTGVPNLVPTGTVTPASAYATQEAARQATVITRATASPFPTAGPATVWTGQPSIATTQRDGLSFQLRLPKDTYLAGEGGQAEAILRNEGPETVFVRGDGENLFLPVLLDEQGHEPVPWPWSPMVLPGIPYEPRRLEPGQVITDTLNFQVPPAEQAVGHTYVLWAETHFCRPAPDSLHGGDNLWLHLETGPISLQVTPPDSSQQLVAELEVDRDGWLLWVTDTAGRVPPGPLWGFHEIVSFDTAATGPLRDSAGGMWSGAWGERVSQSDSQISMRAWVAAPGYVTAAITQTVPSTGDVHRWFSGWEPPTPQTFDSLETAQATLDFPLHQPGWLPAGAVLDEVQVETRTSGERRRTNVSQMYRLTDDAWLELIQMVTTDHYASVGWGQARYEPEARLVAVGENTGYAVQRFGWWVLDWKVGDVGFELRAPVSALSLDDLLSIATGSPAAISLAGRLIYESGGDIWIVELSQPPQVLLTNGSNPHLSPAGDRLVFRRASPELSLPDLWLADFTCPAAPAPCQVNQRRLIGPTEFGNPLIYDLAWSPDGRTVALTTGGYGKIIYSEDLWLVDVETGNYRQVLDGGGMPDYSPDGAWIALNTPYTGYQRGQLSLIAADGSSYRPLFDDLIYYEGKWLASGVLVAGLIRLAQTTEAEDITELWQVPVAGEPVCLTTIRVGRYFRWSADGWRLAYLADDPAGWLHIAQGDGSQPVAVPGTDERTWPHSWSPGGQFLAVIQGEQYSFVSAGPDPALTPMPAPFWLWLDDESYLTAEWITDDPQADRGHFEVSRAWLDGRREFLFEAESLNGLAYRP